MPERQGLPAGYEQKFFSEEEKRGRLRLVASPDGAEGSVRLQQDARIFASILDAGQSVSHTIAKGRKGWLHVVKGSAEVNGRGLVAGDGVAIDGEEKLSVESEHQGHRPHW